jgi:predicted porin
LAFDVVAGSDYFLTPNFSAFVEYKYLNYQSTQIDTRQNRDLGQHLVGAGVRFFFPLAVPQSPSQVNLIGLLSLGG